MLNSIRPFNFSEFGLEITLFLKLYVQHLLHHNVIRPVSGFIAELDSGVFICDLKIAVLEAAAFSQYCFGSVHPVVGGESKLELWQPHQ
jgi:hypothetical protein